MPAKHLYRVNTEGSFHHVYNKGIEGRAIFVDDQDYKTFLSFLEEYLSPPKDAQSTQKEFLVKGRKFKGVPHQPKNYFSKVELVAYNLNPGSFNLLLHQKEGSTISNFIRSICTRYSIYFNKKYQRTGSLFEGPFKSVHLADGSAVLLLTREFHKSGGYSSYPEYLGQRNSAWIKSDIGLSFNKQGNYKDFVEKHNLNQKEEHTLNQITTGEQKVSLVRRDLDNLRLKRKGHRYPEYLFASVIFLVLFGFGLRNINAEADQKIAVTQLKQLSPQVLSVFDVAPTPSPVPLYVANSTPLPSLKPVTAVPTSTLTFQTTAETGVNLRKEPTSSSEVVGVVRNGDIIEVVSDHIDLYKVGLGWYKVKLVDQTEGFILKDFVDTNGAL